MDRNGLLAEPIQVLTKYVNNVFAKKEPWQIAAISASTAFTLVWLWNFVSEDESKSFSLSTDFTHFRKSEAPFCKRKI